ncbi:ATP-dependent 6-phosphofructokinase-like [Daktulosphaira vitifoliae]|uniref:ATP-dependent 6-phosphofructokinase-like n=1 Tax=Daktulosphaira vitifoliae TaxID=58002 RepID=UPI0021A9C9B2|nr:ATP-dependent 6-phosphofructokinase-like [Daktulosphaira vitifoliae]
MNAAVRAVVRTSLQFGLNVYLVKEGYHGLIRGEDLIQQATWYDVSFIIGQGGTVIGTKRCMEFTTIEGRMKAAKNMINLGISNLVVIGGDGSLTGAHIFRQEWPNYVKELLAKGHISEEMSKKCSHLNLVGLVGSIDNDFSGTDMTIGADTALHRILEAVDAITSTASSHKRTFIMEVMGRSCGYLAVKSALMCEADYLFIREWPQPLSWPDKLSDAVREARKMGKRLNIIIVSEGAMDVNGNAITSDAVKKVLVEKLQQDARVTVLGHVQRGGNPSAFDRILASRMGASAVFYILEATNDSESVVVCLSANKIIKLSLMECVSNTLKVAKAIERRDFKTALMLRGPNFKLNLDTYKQLIREKQSNDSSDGNITLILNIGGSSNGINALTYSIVRNTVSFGDRVLGSKYGVEGFIEGDVVELYWSSVVGWLDRGGVKLGITRVIPNDKMLKEMAEKLKFFKINACIIAGGYEALQTAIAMYDNRNKYEEFCIPIAVIPVTYSNNLPGTDFSLGADTALNQVIKLCDIIRQSAEGHRPRTFVVEVLGGSCGYLTTLAAISCGADASFIKEEPFNLLDILHCITVLAEKFSTKKITRGLVLRSQLANENYTTELISNILSEEGKDWFVTRTSALGNIATGGVPSPFDRSIALKLGQISTEWIRNIQSQCSGIVTSPNSAVMIGLRKNSHKYNSLESLRHITKDYIPNDIWWLKLRLLSKMFEDPNYWKQFSN